MAGAAAEAELRFLHTSAHLYAATAPATSAQLMLQRHVEIADDARPNSKDGLISSCKACGTISIPGWTSRMSRVEKRAGKVTTDPKSGSKKHNRARLPANSVKHIRVKCLACHRFEDTPLQKTETRNSSERARATLQKKSPLDAQPNTDPQSTLLEGPNRASKRRERARKQKSGLQAMLENSRTPATRTSGLGLDLMDLMKEG